jgi:hypothetical protein
LFSLIVLFNLVVCFLVTGIWYAVSTSGPWSSTHLQDIHPISFIPKQVSCEMWRSYNKIMYEYVCFLSWECGCVRYCVNVGILNSYRYCRLGSSNFETLTYFKLIWIAEEFLDQITKYVFLYFLSFLVKIAFLVLKKVRSSLYTARLAIFCL